MGVRNAGCFISLPGNGKSPSNEGGYDWLLVWPLVVFGSRLSVCQVHLATSRPLPMQHLLLIALYSGQSRFMRECATFECVPLMLLFYGPRNAFYCDGWPVVTAVSLQQLLLRSTSWWPLISGVTGVTRAIWRHIHCTSIAFVAFLHIFHRRKIPLEKLC